jgi:hypothetical protein
MDFALVGRGHLGHPDLLGDRGRHRLWAVLELNSRLLTPTVANPIILQYT